MALAYVGVSSGFADSATSLTVDKPSGTSIGDIEIVQMMSSGSSDTLSPASGWTQIVASTSNADYTFGAWYRVIQSGDTTWSFTSDGTSTLSFCAVTLSGQHASTPIVDSGSSTAKVAASTNVAVSATGDGSDQMIVVTTGTDVSGSVAWTIDAGTERLDETLSTSEYLGHALYTDTTSSSSTVTRNVQHDYGSSQDVHAVMVLVAPAPSGTAVTPAAESDSAVGLGAVKSRATGPAVETDAAVAVGAGKARALTLAAESDTAVTIVGSKSRALAPAAESDSAVVLGRVKSRALSPAVETDTAVAITPASGGTPITPAVETDTAVALARVKSQALTPATETGAAVALGAVKARAVGPASETDTAPSLGAVKARALTTAVETDTAVPITATGSTPITPAAETDTAGSLTRVKLRVLAPAAESDFAVAILTSRAATGTATAATPSTATTQRANPTGATATASTPTTSTTRGA